MHRKLHQRLRDLRLSAGFKTQKHFLAYASRKGHAFSERRYGQLERDEATPRVDEVITLCRLLSVPTDALLIGEGDIVVISGLGVKGRKALLRIADEIRKLEQ